MENIFNRNRDPRTAEELLEAVEELVNCLIKLRRHRGAAALLTLTITVTCTLGAVICGRWIDVEYMHGSLCSSCEVVELIGGHPFRVEEAVVLEGVQLPDVVGIHVGVVLTDLVAELLQCLDRAGPNLNCHCAAPFRRLLTYLNYSTRCAVGT